MPTDEDTVETCHRSGCDEDAEVTIRYIQTNNEIAYCIEDAEDALEQFDDANVGEPL